MFEFMCDHVFNLSHQYTAWTGTHNITTRTDQTVRMMETSSLKTNVPAGGEGCFEGLKIVVPSASPSNNPGCKIIKVNYKLKVRIPSYQVLQIFACALEMSQTTRR